MTREQYDKLDPKSLTIEGKRIKYKCLLYFGLVELTAEDGTLFYKDMRILSKFLNHI